MNLSHKRPGLRTKTGCLTCRRQKKKCDEKKPACGDCSKFERACIWPTVLTDRRHGSNSLGSSSNFLSPNSPRQISARVTLFDPQNQVTCYHPATPSARDRMLFNHFVTYVMPRAIHANAHPVHAEYKDAYQLGFQMSGIMGVYMGIAALYIAKDNEKSSLLATELYTPSINAVITRIRKGEIDGTEEWLFILTLFMLLFELSRFDVNSHLMVHLEGLAQLFTARKAKNILSDPQKPYHRLVAEAFTYHLATASLLSGEIDHIATQFKWSDLNEYNELVLFQNASELANSPILGSNAGLFQMIFEITRLSRHTPLDSLQNHQAVAYSAQLDFIQHDMAQDVIYIDNTDEYEFRKGILLYILVSKLFLVKILNPEVNCQNPIIRQLVSQSLFLLAKCKPRVSCTTFYCWPLIILTCAVRNEEEMSLIRAKLSEVWEDPHCGQAYRTTKIINAIWDDRMDCYGGERGSFCNMDKLIHKSGLISSVRNKTW